MAKNISLLYLLVTVSITYSSAFATGLMIAQAQDKKQCTGKVAKERQPLFIVAEKYEEDFVKAYTECSEKNNCDINETYAQTRRNVLLTVFALTDHLQNLEQDTSGVCHSCEKTEAKDIKRRLTELLTNHN